MSKQFLQETNFDDESKAFKNDALDNFKKAYPTDDTSRIKENLKGRYSQWEEPEGDDSY